MNMQKNRSQNMLIKEITVQNLKTFVQPQRLKLAPITLLYGENSSGKTSVMKILDILMNIFGYGYKKPITEVGDKFIYNSHHKHYNVKCYNYRACDKCHNTFNNILIPSIPSTHVAGTLTSQTKRL